MIDLSETVQFPMIALPVAPQFDYMAALYFLSSGDLLYKDSKTSKFITVLDAAAAFTQKDIDTDWFPAGVVRCGACAAGRWFVYSAPPQKVTLALSASPGAPENLAVPLPRTVLLGVGQSYYIWAAKTKFFDPDADAFHAPFPNVYESGAICWGQNNPAQADAQHARKIWDLFFNSVFNQDLSADKSKKMGSACSLLRLLHDQKADKFPIADLKPVNKSIRSLVENILEQK